ncbi:hypothetical protein [Adhaeretor mobilis]|uniref:Uncharacterized protein n=1 Tax=Adhaeretor mobilis TaxID=1930276 RepID=A0A517MV04_9BACT|nr:hypothetical protein [Adhaeretor mobilis]QDS98617.1 hypothetical protein HG15A2_18980 [Adhaeretor mobilis]
MDLLEKPAQKIRKDANQGPAPYILNDDLSQATASELTLLVETSGYAPAAIDRSLASLRSAGAQQRRLVWLHAEQTSDTNCDWKEIGHRFAAEASVDLFLTTGFNAREVALGARDAGLFLSNVVVCTDQATACQVLTERLAPGDAILLHEVSSVASQALQRWLKQLWQPMAAA